MTSSIKLLLTRSVPLQADIRKTSTGIYSPRPPGHLSNGAYPASGSATPAQTPSTSTSAAFNADIIAQAKLEAARRELYSKFLRGRPLAGTADDDSDDGGKAAPDASLSHSSKAVQEASAPSDESQKAQDKTERRILRAEKKALKEQKRAAKEARRKGKGVAEPLGDEEAGEPVGTALDIPDNAEDQPDVLSEPASRKSKKRKVRDRDIEVGTTTIQEIDAAPAEDAPPDKPPSKTKVKRSKAEKAAQKRSKLEEL